MGTNDKEGEGPTRKVKVNAFAIDRYTVSNEQFKEFIEETGYVTEAEKFDWSRSFVFHLLAPDNVKKEVKQSVSRTPWWLVVEGAHGKILNGQEPQLIID